MATTSLHPTTPPPDGRSDDGGTPTADAYRRLRAHDPRLIAALRAGDAATVTAVCRVLRVTPLAQLVTDTGALVTAVAAMPTLPMALEASWRRQDPVVAGRVLAWVQQARRHHQPRSEPLLPVT